MNGCSNDLVRSPFAFAIRTLRTCRCRQYRERWSSCDDRNECFFYQIQFVRGWIETNNLTSELHIEIVEDRVEANELSLYRERGGFRGKLEVECTAKIVRRQRRRSNVLSNAINFCVGLVFRCRRGVVTEKAACVTPLLHLNALPFWRDALLSCIINRT